MKRLFFEINQEFRKYTVIEYSIDGEFYLFTDIRDGKFRKLHKDFFKGEEEVRQ